MVPRVAPLRRFTYTNGSPVGESNAGSSRVPRSSASASSRAVAAEFVARQQPAQQPDHDLEVLHLDIRIEREPRDDEFARTGGLLLQCPSG